MSTTSHQGLLALGSSLLALSVVSVILRFYSRRIQKEPLKIDDWIMIPCLLLLGGSCGTAFYGVNRKILGYPTPSDNELVIATAATASKLYFTFDLFSVLTLGCVKISALFFYYRIFCEHGRRNVFGFLVIISIVVMSISDFLLDFWIISLPIPQILKIKTSLSRRLAIIGVFLLAFVGFGACIARLAVFVELDRLPATVKVDSRLTNTKSIFLSLLELGLSCIAVNIPSLYYLSNKVTPENVLRSL
ncbi:hypothetical protein DID88_001063 [Monilinia fructigena]|uniref:Rhodopsin domain-containing protein n=1 Tax=Monilinia fructigena TaxID=38457 RepID=A0A395IZ15_9HELO|nr:hypothetical protein DID88_001063 [Monilinia fructigena]